MNIRPLYTPRAIADALPLLAEAIIAQLGDEDSVRAFILLNGGIWFGCDLLRLLPPNYTAETIRVSSYGTGTESSGQLVWREALPDCKNARILVIDDILDTGITLQQVTQAFLEAGARSVHTAVAIDKKERRCNDFAADFALFSVERGFLVGYGMDCGGLYRNLPYIGVAEPDDASGRTGMP